MSDSEEAEEFHVETILDKRITKTGTEYLIKWKGYPEEESTWEPESHCDCADMINEFEVNWVKRGKLAGKEPQPKLKKKQTVKKRALVESDSEPEIIDDNEDNNKKKKQVTAKRNSNNSTATTSALSGDNKAHEVTKKRPKINESGDEENDDKTGGTIASNLTHKSNEPQIRQVTGSNDDFDTGLEPERIIGATDRPFGELHFLIKWKNQSKADLISARVAKLACPQFVIAFFEERMVWNEPIPADKLD